MFPTYDIEFFPKIARGHGRRNTKSPVPCAKPMCRGTEASGHTYDRGLNQLEYRKEREFGELIAETLKRYK